MASYDFDVDVRQQPFRHRKPFWETIYPKSLAIVAVKNGAVISLKLLSAEVPPAIPWDDRIQLADFAVRQLRVPIIKDLLTTFAARFYEHLIVDHYYAGNPLAGARFVRDTAYDAKRAFAIAQRQQAEKGAGEDLAAALQSRARVALHILAVQPFPSAVANAAYFTVEEGSIILQYLYRNRRRAAAEAVLEKPSSRPDQIAAAHRELIEHEETPGSSLLHDSVELAVRSGSSVILESICASIGTFVFPGLGTFWFGAVGSVACWLI